MSDPRLSNLSDRQLADLDSMRRWAMGEHSATQLILAAAKLECIEHHLHSGLVNAQDQWKLAALGVMFGDALVQIAEGALAWVHVIDHQGATFALQWRKTEVLVYPVQAIAGRLADGEALDVRALFVEYTKALPLILR